MSTTWWIVFAAYLAASVLVPFLWCRGARRANARRERADQRHAALMAEINARLRGLPAAPDNREGMRLDWADECELLWAAPSDPQTSSRKEDT